MAAAFGGGEMVSVLVDEAEEEVIEAVGELDDGAHAAAGFVEAAEEVQLLVEIDVDGLLDPAVETLGLAGQVGVAVEVGGVAAYVDSAFVVEGVVNEGHKGGGSRRRGR